jgi:hypothetical protein
MGSHRKVVPKIGSNVRTTPHGWRAVLRRYRKYAPLLAIIPALAAILKMADPSLWRNAGLQPPLEFFVHHLALLRGVAAGLAAAILCVLFGKEALLWLVGLWVRHGYGPFNTCQAAVDCRRYRELITNDRRMLGISIRSLAKQAGLSLIAGWYICEKPDFLPHLDVINEICRVLMTDPRRLRDGRGYGAKCTLQRMLRYHDLGLVALTRSRIRKATVRQRCSLLSWVERRRRKNLALPKDPRDHE